MFEIKVSYFLGQLSTVFNAACILLFARIAKTALISCIVRIRVKTSEHFL